MKKQRKIAVEPAVSEAKAAPGVTSNLPSAQSRGSAPGGARSSVLPRIDLLVLTVIVVMLNAPYLGGRFMPDHDTRSLLGFLDYFYSNYLHFGELPRWMVYGLYGLDASAYQVGNLSVGGFLAVFLGKILGVNDSLQVLGFTVSIEQLLLLLGLYLLCRRLFKERLTVFCVCLFLVTTVIWQEQTFMNFRLYYLLPLAMYLILRLKEDGLGWCGWLAGAVAVLGPLGNALYCYPFWAFVLAAYSIALFWGNFRPLLAMIKINPLNIATAAVFVVAALAFAGSLSHAIDNSKFVSVDRDSSGGVALPSFLTYGGNALSDIWRSLFVPSAFVTEERTNPGRFGMDDYTGIICLLGLPFAVRQLLSRESRALAIAGAAVFALSRGGVLATLIYYFPGMHLYRHVGFVTAVIKLFAVVVAGFGLDALFRKIRDGTLIKDAGYGSLAVMLAGTFFYLDMYVGGPLWAMVFGGFQAATAPGVDVSSSSVTYPVLRALMLAALALVIWASSRNSAGRNLAVYCVAACLAGDCVLFQLETRSLLHLEPEKISFPALKPNFIAERSDRIRVLPEIIPKFQAWEKSHGSDYQITCASPMQWDSLTFPTPMRSDWFPSNVLISLQTVEQFHSNEVAAIFAPKLRLLTQAVVVPSNEQALTLLQSETGWASKVILTAPADAVPTGANQLNTPAGDVSVEQFSANELSVDVKNTSAGPAWLVYADAYTPDWHAEVNGKPVTIREAYAAFKAVRVDPGESHVRFYYDRGWHSRCLSLLGALSGLAAAAGLGCLLWVGIREMLGAKTGPAKS